MDYEQLAQAKEQEALAQLEHFHKWLGKRLEYFKKHPDSHVELALVVQSTRGSANIIENLMCNAAGIRSLVGKESK